MNLVHLTASTFFGGPERQMLGLAPPLSGDVQSIYLSFPEGGKCSPFLEQVRHHGFFADCLENDFPKIGRTLSELTAKLRQFRADILLTHGYKANILGRIAARRLGIPIVGVSRGWTGENRKVQLYELLDKIHLRWLDAVVCVSEGQAQKVRRVGVAAQKIRVIRNAARPELFDYSPARSRAALEQLAQHRGLIVVSAGRLSPEKGYTILVEAAARVLRVDSTIRFVHFGDGVLRESIQKRLEQLHIDKQFRLLGYRNDLDRLLGGADLFCLPSFTEGLPNVVLEASAQGVACVATAVGGTPEVIVSGETGILVPPKDPEALAEAILALLQNPHLRTRYGQAARERMLKEFTFEAQARQYLELFQELRNEKESSLAGSLT